MGSARVGNRGQTAQLRRGHLRLQLPGWTRNRSRSRNRSHAVPPHTISPCSHYRPTPYHPIPDPTHTSHPPTRTWPGTLRTHQPGSLLVRTHPDPELAPGTRHLISTHPAMLPSAAVKCETWRYVVLLVLVRTQPCCRRLRSSVRRGGMWFRRSLQHRNRSRTGSPTNPSLPGQQHSPASHPS